MISSTSKGTLYAALWRYSLWSTIVGQFTISVSIFGAVGGAALIYNNGNAILDFDLRCLSYLFFLSVTLLGGTFILLVMKSVYRWR